MANTTLTQVHISKGNLNSVMGILSSLGFNDSHVSIFNEPVSEVPTVVFSGTMVNVNCRVYGTTHTGRLIYNDDQIIKAHTHTYGTWTIELPNGKRFRNEGVLTLA